MNRRVLLLLLAPVWACATPDQPRGDCTRGWGSGGRPGRRPAQASAAPTSADITAADLMTRLYIFADDSMPGQELAPKETSGGPATSPPNHSAWDWGRGARRAPSSDGPADSARPRLLLTLTVDGPRFC